MTKDDRLSFALAIATEAGALAQKMRRAPTGLQTWSKGRLDFVTAADLEVEALLRRKIAERFPGESVLGEEAGLDFEAKGVWIVDPIDGTTNFSRGMREWAVSIAYFDGTEITHGVIHAPDLNMTAWARKGEQTQLNGTPVDLTVGAPNLAPVVELGVSKKTPLPDYLERITKLTEAGIEHRRKGAATVAFIGVLAGWVDAYYEAHLNIWDAAAGVFLTKLAKGRALHLPIRTFLTEPSFVFAENGRITNLLASLDIKA